MTKVVAENEIADVRFGPGFNRKSALSVIRALTSEIGQQQRKLEEADAALEPYRALMNSQVVPAVLEHAIDVSAMDWNHSSPRFRVSVDPDDARQGRIEVTQPYYSMGPEDIASTVGHSLQQVLNVFGFDGWEITCDGPNVVVCVK